MCPKFLSSHMRAHNSIDTPPNGSVEESSSSSERKDLLPWPIKTRKRGRSIPAVKAEKPSNPPLGKELITSSTPTESSSWSFTDLPPKKRILLAAQARRVDRFMCVICGRVFEDFHALGGHKSQHRKRASPIRACPEAVVACKSEIEIEIESACVPLVVQQRCKVLPDFDINVVPDHSDGEEETLALPWYDRFPVET